MILKAIAELIAELNSQLSKTNMKKYIFILMFLIAYQLNAQVQIDTAYGIIGQSTRLAIKLSPELYEHNIHIEGQFHLSNPTVFYPDSIVCTIEELDCNIQRINEFTYKFAVSGLLSDVFEDSLTIYVVGELLASYDSICVINFDYLKISENYFEELYGIVKSTSIGTPLPYVRKAVLSPNYPNPLFAGEKTEWGFRIDAESEVRFTIIDLNAKVLYDIDYGLTEPGLHKFILETDLTLAAGIYYIQMWTPNSSNSRKFMVIK